MTNNQKVTKETLVGVIQSLANAFQAGAEVKHYEMCAKYLKKYEDSLLNPEKYGVLVGYDLEQFHQVLIRNLLNTEQVTKDVTYTEEQVDKLLFLYEHYQFMDSQLDQIVMKYEGWTCSADKTRHVLDLYRQYILTGQIPVFDDRSHYWVPYFGTAENWILFTESLRKLYYGYADNYIEARQTLVHDIEKAAEEKREKQKEHFLKHPTFTETSESKKGGVVYHFAGEEGGEEILLQLHVLDSGDNGYILTQGGKRLSYKDERPEWVQSLIKQL